MSELFAKQIIDPEWGNYYVLTTWGYMALIALMLLILLAAALFTNSKKLNTRQLVFCAMSMSLATVTSYIKIDFCPGFIRVN